MLESVEAERDHSGGAVGAPDSEDPAFLAELVPIETGVEWMRGQHS
jgi:hypothetical protein